MSRLIDADALKENIPNTNVDIFENCHNCTTLCDWEVKELIDKQPVIDAVDVVRCRDCIHHYVDGEYVRYNCCELNHNKVQSDDWFCADGERVDEQ